MNKDQLLQAFSTYLERAEEEAAAAGEEVDLHTLFTEMAALRNEVKTESRQFKNALDEFRGVFETLQESHGTLNKALERSTAECRKQTRETLRSFLLDLLEIYDRMEAGLHALHAYKPGFWGGKHQLEFVESVREGQGMTLRRVGQLLERYHIQALDTLGKPLDPHTMRAVETVSDPEYANGSVVEELRKGFLWEDEVLRLAEVRVNKLQPNEP